MVTDPDGDMLPEHDLTQSGVVTTPAETVLCSIRLISGGSVIGHFLDIFRLRDMPFGMTLRSGDATCESSWTTVAELLVAQLWKASPNSFGDAWNPANFPASLIF